MQGYNTHMKRYYRAKSKKLLSLLIDRELTQADIARMSRLSTSEISLILDGKAGSIKSFKRIAAALGVPCKDISRCLRKLQ